MKMPIATYCLIQMNKINPTTQATTDQPQTNHLQTTEIEIISILSYNK